MINMLAVINIPEKTSKHLVFDYIKSINEKLKDKLPDFDIYDVRKIRNFYVHNDIEFYTDNLSFNWFERRYRYKFYYKYIGALTEEIKDQTIRFKLPRVKVDDKLLEIIDSNI